MKQGWKKTWNRSMVLDWLVTTLRVSCVILNVAKRDLNSLSSYHINRLIIDVRSLVKAGFNMRPGVFFFPQGEKKNAWSEVRLVSIWIVSVRWFFDVGAHRKYRKPSIQYSVHCYLVLAFMRTKNTSWKKSDLRKNFSFTTWRYKKSLRTL